MILFLYFAGLGLLIYGQVVFSERYGWRGLLVSALTELVLILGGGTLFWMWWTKDWGPVDPETSAEGLFRQEEAIGFALMWQAIPMLVVLLTVVAIAIADLILGAQRDSDH